MNHKTGLAGIFFLTAHKLTFETRSEEFYKVAKRMGISHGWGIGFPGTKAVFTYQLDGLFSKLLRFEKIAQAKGWTYSLAAGPQDLGSVTHEQLILNLARYPVGMCRSHLIAELQTWLHNEKGIANHPARELADQALAECYRAKNVVRCRCGWMVNPRQQRKAWEQRARWRAHNLLLFRIKQRLPQLRSLFKSVDINGRAYEDGMYRFYHQSFKVYYLIQDKTKEMVRELQLLLPTRPLNSWFRQIVKEGTGKQFDLSHNQKWLEMTRPMLEAFFHARYMVEMAVHYGDQLPEASLVLPSGWASLLCLFNLR